MTPSGQYYPSRSNHKDDDCRSFSHYKSDDFELDIYLNADEGRMKLGVVDSIEMGEPRLKNLPLNTSNGWVPYFVFNSPIGSNLNTTLRIAKIPIEWYGSHVDGIF